MEEAKQPTELLLLIFIHGFKGSNNSFADFPERLVHILSASEPQYEVQPIVYPSYDTRGELIVAVDNHVSWLTNLVAERKAAFQEKVPNGQARVIMLGHSMGGLVIADTVLSTIESAALPILGVIAYDTPYLGLHPAVFKNTFDKALGYASQGQAALTALGAGYGFIKSATGGKAADNSAKEASKKKSTPSEAPPDAVLAATANNSKSWFSLATVAAVTAAAGAIGAAGAAYYNRETLATHWAWATSHLSFVGELWKTEELEKRVQNLVAAKQKGAGFHCWYTTLANGAAGTPSRTFCILPQEAGIKENFTANQNNRASDEIIAHIDMFVEKSDGVYTLATETCQLISDWLLQARQGKMGVGITGSAESSEKSEKMEMA